MRVMLMRRPSRGADGELLRRDLRRAVRSRVKGMMASGKRATRNTKS